MRVCEASTALYWERATHLGRALIPRGRSRRARTGGASEFSIARFCIFAVILKAIRAPRYEIWAFAERSFVLADSWHTQRSQNPAGYPDAAL